MINNELINLRKSLLKNVKEELKDRLGKQPPELEKYYNEYRREFRKGYKKVSSKKELIAKLLKQDIVLCGDYHTLKQAQNTAYKILLELIKKRELVLCLELINDKKQDFLDKFINQEISEKDFLKLINYKEVWGFNWKNYLPLFKFAIKNRVKVYGINRAPNSLRVRDKIAAQNIVNAAKSHPDALIFVLYGDLHIASNHLPLQVKQQAKESGLKKKIFQIFQNSEPIYWEILEREINANVDVVQLKSRSYCIQNTPPWVKLQSYLIWAEHGENLLNKEALYFIQKGAGDKDLDCLDDDVEDEFSHTDLAKEQFYSILELLCDFFKVDHVKLIDPQIVSIEDFNISEELKNDPLIKPHRYREIVEQILIRKTYYVYEKNLIFLSSYSLNHAAHSAATFLFFQLAGLEKIKKEGFDKFKERFYRRVLIDAIGFLGSKIVNPKRKCFTYADHNEYFIEHKYSKNPSIVRKRKIAKFTMEHKLKEDLYQQGKTDSIKLRKIYYVDSRLAFGISKTIGHQLGNALYFAMIYNIVDQPFVFDLLKTRIDLKNKAYDKFLYLLKKLKDYDPIYKSKTDFF